mmetsp:Transcript_36134/g.96697  ORF Transcript_36134/g.96697 Transcript_36134/m.96697 type:complete len:220 (+) Transcript_36134:415-1074(+)
MVDRASVGTARTTTRTRPRPTMTLIWRWCYTTLISMVSRPTIYRPHGSTTTSFSPLFIRRLTTAPRHKTRTAPLKARSRTTISFRTAHGWRPISTRLHRPTGPYPIRTSIRPSTRHHRTMATPPRAAMRSTPMPSSATTSTPTRVRSPRASGSSNGTRRPTTRWRRGTQRTSRAGSITSTARPTRATDMRWSCPWLPTRSSTRPSPRAPSRPPAWPRQL